MPVCLSSLFAISHLKYYVHAASSSHVIFLVFIIGLFVKMDYKNKVLNVQVTEEHSNEVILNLMMSLHKLWWLHVLQ